MDSDAFSGVKKLFKGGREDKDLVDPFTLVKFAGKEASFARFYFLSNLLVLFISWY